MDQVTLTNTSGLSTMAPEEDEKMSNLRHVYFFLNVSSISTAHAPAIAASEDRDSDKSGEVYLASTAAMSPAPQGGNPRSSSPESNATGEASSISSTISELNPLANDFTPGSNKFIPPQSSSTSNLFELRDTKDRGLGLFAIAPIPLGTMVMCEGPLFKIPAQAPQFSWGAYCRLRNSEKATYDKLHAFQPADMNLEQVSRTCIIDHKDDSMDEEDVEEAVQEHVRVMKIYVTNNFSLPPNETAVYAMASRINHSCVPNVHHSFNSTLKKLTVFAVRDIKPGEELQISYLGGFGCYLVRSQRLGLLRANYGFTCQCPACTDPTLTSDGSRSCSDARREEMIDISSSLNQLSLSAAHIRSPTGQEVMSGIHQDALAQVWKLIALLLEEGLVTIELNKAYRTASEIALAMGDYANAVEYAYDEATVERNCLGRELQELKKLKVASECWIDVLRETIMKDLGKEAAKTFFKSAKKQRYKNSKKRQSYKKKKNNEWKADRTDEAGT